MFDSFDDDLFEDPICKKYPIVTSDYSKHWYRNEQSFERAAEWFEQAARQGHAQAMHSLGCLYRDGIGGNQRSERLAEWFEQAARRVAN